MKKGLLKMILGVAMTTTISASAGQVAGAQEPITTIYELANSKLHVMQTNDPLGDVSFIIEGKDALVLFEQPAFVGALDSFNDYASALGKPIEKVVASYHQGGLAGYKGESIAMPEAMLSFSQDPKSIAIMDKFRGIFGEAIDLRPFGKVKTFAVPSTQNWAGVEFKFSSGAASDFPAASVQIDKDAFHTHFSPSKSHAKPMQLSSLEALEAMLGELTKIKNSGAKYIFGSHGAPATMAEVDFQIEYLYKVKELLSKCSDADVFGQRLLASYPSLAGAENVKVIAASLYPDQVKDEAKEQVRARMQDYLNMVSDLDVDIAENLWAKDYDISLIAPRSHFFGFENIMNDFLLKAFSQFKSRKLSSLSEVINVYDNSANVQLYWNFDTVNAEGVANQGRGRETLVFEKIGGEWKLVHVHYSVMPQQ